MPHHYTLFHARTLLFVQVNVDTGKEHVQDCSPFQLDLLYLKDCGECEVPASAAEAAQNDNKDDDGGDGHDRLLSGSDSNGVFDARVYAKDESQYHAEMAEAMDALSARAAALEAENEALKEALAKVLGK